jgi:hypothetical protein
MGLGPRIRSNRFILEHLCSFQQVIGSPVELPSAAELFAWRTGLAAPQTQQAAILRHYLCRLSRFAYRAAAGCELWYPLAEPLEGFLERQDNAVQSLRKWTFWHRRDEVSESLDQWVPC